MKQLEVLDYLCAKQLMMKILLGHSLKKRDALDDVFRGSASVLR